MQEQLGKVHLHSQFILQITKRKRYKTSLMTLKSVKCWDTMRQKSLNHLPKSYQRQYFAAVKTTDYVLIEHALHLRPKITQACTTTSPRVRFINAGDVGYKTAARTQSQSKHSFQSKFQQKQDRSRITANLIKCKWINFKATPSKNVSHLGVLYWQLKLNRMWNHCHSTPASCVVIQTTFRPNVKNVVSNWQTFKTRQEAPQVVIMTAAHTESITCNVLLT